MSRDLLLKKGLKNGNVEKLKNGNGGKNLKMTTVGEV